MEKFVSKLLVLTLIAWMFIGCQGESTTLTTLFYENNSGADITVVKIGSNKKPIHILNGDTYQETGGGTPGDGIEQPFGWYSDIEVIFNNDRSIIYKYMDSEAFNNPLMLSNYEIIKVKEEKRLVMYECYYTFVPEQYEMAEPYDPDTPEE